MRAQPPRRDQAAGTVLVVDDEAVDRLLLVRSLELEGLQVASAGDGLEALDMLQLGLVFCRIAPDDPPRGEGRQPWPS